MNTSKNTELQIIGLAGLPGSGKDTVADILVSHLGFEKIAFADALRDEVSDAFDIDVAVLTGRASKEAQLQCLAFSNCKDLDFYEKIVDLGLFIDSPKMHDAPRAPRQITQWWGTEYRRAQDPEYWLIKMAKKIEIASKTTNRIVVSDVRFDNEATFLKTVNYSEFLNHIKTEIWRVVNGPMTIAPSSHASDAALDSEKIDTTIFNDHAIIDLVGPVLLQWLSMEANQSLHTISRSKNHVNNWHYE